jgi:hypothetical protein
MEILVVYSEPEMSYIHQEAFVTYEQIEEARRFAKEKRGMLFIKVASDPLQVENYTSDPLPSAHRYRSR